MKKLLTIIILILSFQSWVKADNAKDFVIEGLSIGDSLLNYFSKKEINSKKQPLKMGKDKYSDEYSAYIYEDPSKLKNYEYLSLIFQSNDPKFIIQSISARIEYDHQDISKCYELQKEIIDQIRLIATNAIEDNQGKSKHRGLPDGNSYKTVTNFIYDDDSYIHISCYDFAKNDTDTPDRISVSVLSSEYIDFQKNRAFK